MTSIRKGRGPRSGEREHQPAAGCADPGKTVDPMAMPKQHEPDARGETKSAPAPGVPVSRETYESLKSKAKTSRVRRSRYAQEDPSEA